MFKALRTIRTNETCTTVLEDMYTRATAKVHVDNQVSEKIPIPRGVRQGDQISPNYSLQQFRRSFKAQLEEKGINIDGKKKLLDLRFADDVALTTEGVKDMERHLNNVIE